MANKRTLSAREVLQDIRSGITDDELMRKCQLSPHGLKSLFDKLVSAGLLTQSDLEHRNAARDKVIEASPGIPESTVEQGPPAGPRLESPDGKPAQAPWKCPACGMLQMTDYLVCPQCGVIVEKYKAKIAKEQQVRTAAAGSNSFPLPPLPSQSGDTSPPFPPAQPGEGLPPLPSEMSLSPLPPLPIAKEETSPADHQRPAPEGTVQPEPEIGILAKIALWIVLVPVLIVSYLLSTRITADTTLQRVIVVGICMGAIGILGAAATLIGSRRMVSSREDLRKRPLTDIKPFYVGVFRDLEEGRRAVRWKLIVLVMLFAEYWYLFKGMWRKGLVLVGISFTFSMVLNLAFPNLNTVTGFILFQLLFVLVALFVAPWDYYLYRMHGEAVYTRHWLSCITGKYPKDLPRSFLFPPGPDGIDQLPEEIERTDKRIGYVLTPVVLIIMSVVGAGLDLVLESRASLESYVQQTKPLFHRSQTRETPSPVEQTSPQQHRVESQPSQPPSTPSRGTFVGPDYAEAVRGGHLYAFGSDVTVGEVFDVVSRRTAKWRAGELSRSDPESATHCLVEALYTNERNQPVIVQFVVEKNGQRFRLHGVSIGGRFHSDPEFLLVGIAETYKAIKKGNR